MLKAFKQGEELRSKGPISVRITKEDFIRYWKNFRELTASSVSQLHFGRYKAAAQDDNLSEAHAIILDMVTRMGTSLPRWQYGLTVVLEKKPGCLLIEKLWAILLMEADFNMINKLIVGVRMMHLAEETNEMPIEQSGGRKHHSADEAALN